MMSDVVIVYAKWSKNFYELNYGTNGGIGTMPIVDVNQGDSVLTLNSNFTKEGYNFKNWNTKADGIGISYEVGDFLNPETASRILVGKITLYAQWSSNVSIEKPNSNVDNKLEETGFSIDISVIFNLLLVLLMFFLIKISFKKISK